MYAVLSSLLISSEAFAKAWGEAKNSTELRNARQQSEKNEETRCSKQIWKLKQLQKKAASIRKWIAEDPRNWRKLNKRDQQLWYEHDDQDTNRKIAALQAQQQPRFQGTAASIARSIQNTTNLT